MKLTKLDEMPPVVAQEAWQLSRPNQQQPTPLEEVLAVDAPVNELPSYILLFEDFTILEREIIATPRNHVMWARTSRVDDPTKFTVPVEYAEKIPTATIRQSMAKAKQHGKPQDTWRAKLPIFAHTSWVARVSLRDLIKLALYFEYLAAKFARYRQRWQAIAEAMRSFTTHRLNYQLDKYLYEQQLNGDTHRAKFGSGWSIIYAKVPLMLRAQLVRHRPLHFIDNLFSLLRHDALPQYDLNTTIYMELCATDAIWHEIISKRNCWIAQADLWKPITVYFNEQTLPCSGSGCCPYGTDNVQRMAGLDPNPPCPLYLKLNNQSAANWLPAIATHMKNKPDWWRALPL